MPELLIPHTTTELATLQEQLDRSDATIELLQEAFAELEMELDEGWTRLAGGNANEFTRTGLRKLIGLARVMYLKNPLIQRAVNVQAFYTWAQGVQIHAEDETVNEVIQRFLDDPGNKRAYSGETARIANDITLANDGNVVFVLFPSISTGHVRIRTLPIDEITDIICDPDDRSAVWFFKREWQQVSLNAMGRQQTTPMEAYYPAVGYRPGVQVASIGGKKVMWESPVYHVKSGGLTGMRFGVPETYSSLDWARAYKNFLEDWASLTRSLSRFAWRLTTKNNKVQAAKTRLNSTLGTSSGETNPPSTTGAAFISDENVKMDAIPKTGAAPSAQDGKLLRLMVAAAMNIPDTILSGDVDQGNLATSKTLDRPTELAFMVRQGLWRQVEEDILLEVIKASVAAPSGRLTGKITVDADGIEEVVLNGKADAAFEVKFPAILEHDILGRIQAITTAATLDGKAKAGTIPDDTVSQMLLMELGADNVDELLEELAANRDDAEAAGITNATVEALQEARRALAAVS
jgi:hypothetical protein